MKICIYGAGAIGGYLASGLAAVEGVELSLIARGPHLAALKQCGLTVKTEEDSRTITTFTATDNPAILGEQDYVISCLKAHQSAESADCLPPLLGPDTAVVTCQNGLPWWYFYQLPGPYQDERLHTVDPNGRQWTLIDPERVIGCVVYPATEIVAPGIIRHIYGNKFALGEPDGSVSKRCSRLSEALTVGGFKAPVLNDIRSEIWLKLWGNLCFNPISALTRSTLDVIATDPDTQMTADLMMREAEVIGEKLGATFRVNRERRINGAAGVGAHRTSMLQDLEGGRDMEIDALVTAVQETGRIVNVPTPTIDIVLGLVRQLSRTMGLYPGVVSTSQSMINAEHHLSV
jgi:2-dehydropantoate 2-reductase